MTSNRRAAHGARTLGYFHAVLGKKINRRNYPICGFDDNRAHTSPVVACFANLVEFEQDGIIAKTATTVQMFILK